ncbi:hypothetical protein Moror_15517 [Moniliophthora roreri MCA 2997]|uniref:Uncharacterized protein n=1 Tax=Moniliophthora roreri (strain MCA 2997) TaxID=1381753 RepID=V2WGE9_MONRO|nr:hypothetical protein Moror_15517 [Moniliophthora roreri MCA 2997]
MSKPFSTQYTLLSQSLTEQSRPECPEPQTPRFLTPPSMPLPPPSLINLPVQLIRHQTLSEEQDSPQNSPSPLFLSTQTLAVHIQLVWDDEEEDQEDRRRSGRQKKIRKTEIHKPKTDQLLLCRLLWNGLTKCIQH